jgi:hypothetical protein
MVGVPPSLGRWFRTEEDNPGTAPVIVLSHLYWQNHFKSDPAIVGRPLKINGEWGTIIGVGPVDYRFPEAADAWVPLRYKKTDEKRDVRFMELMGRLKDGVSTKQAQAEFATLNQRIATAHPDTVIGSYPFQDEEQKPNTNLVVRSRDPAKLTAAMNAVKEMLAGLNITTR